MSKRITTKDRRFVSRTETRLDNNWTWREIGNAEKKNQNTCYAKYYRIRARIIEERIKKLESASLRAHSTQSVNCIAV